MDDADDVDVELQGRVSFFVHFEQTQVSATYRIKEILGEQLL